MKVCFTNKILNIDWLIHVDVKVAIIMFNISEFYAKKVGNFTLKVNFILFTKFLFKFLFNCRTGTEIDEIIDE